MAKYLILTAYADEIYFVKINDFYYSLTISKIVI